MIGRTSDWLKGGGWLTLYAGGRRLERTAEASEIGQKNILNTTDLQAKEKVLRTQLATLMSRKANR